MIYHFARMLGVTIVLLLGIFYPFLPGTYDRLALPLSTLIQVGAAFSLLLVPIGGVWLVYEARKQAQRKQNLTIQPRRNRFVVASVIACSIIALAVTLAAFATVGFSFAFLTFALGLVLLSKLFSRFVFLKNKEGERFSPMPFYLVFVPLAAALLQFVLAVPATNFSRDAAIANCREFIGDIETYRAQSGRYPTSLLAMYKDYDPNVVGIEKYHYTPTENAYNLFFEQPRLLFDKFGAREWVVYNPLDEHRVFSHTSWFLLLAPEELERSQGWYAVHETAHPHWKYYWFD